MTSPKGIAIYHRMYAREDFLTTAGMLWTMVREAAARYPGAPRMLYLDIDGHGRDEYDDEASEVISFTRAALGPFLTEAPWGKTDEGSAQSENLPDVIVTFAADGQTRTLTGDRDEPVHIGTGLPAGADKDRAIVCAIYARTHGAFAREQETEDHAR